MRAQLQLPCLRCRTWRLVRPATGEQTPPRIHRDSVQGAEAFTPGLRAALLVARVNLGDVSPTAPRSSLEALNAGPTAYGPETPVVWNLAVASMARKPTPVCERRAVVTLPPTVLPQATPAAARPTMHAADAQKRAKHDDAICVFMEV